MDGISAEPIDHMDGESARRVRIVSWEDYLPSATAAAEMNGLEFLQATVRGEFPVAPIMELIGIRLASVRKGEAVFHLDPAEFHYNPIGSVGGGVHATLLDTAAACAVYSELPAGARYTSLDLSVRFIRPIRIDTGTVTSTGTVIHAGRRAALAKARIEDGAGTLLATATSNCLIDRP